MKKHLFFLFALVAVFACVSCAKDNLEQGVTPDDAVENAGAKDLATIKLASFPGDESRISYPVVSRAEEDQPAALELVAEIDNPSKAEGFELVQGEGRYLSATSVYYNASTDTYYATYHMQGNNYNTTLANEIGGAVQAFQVAGNKVTLLPGFRAADPKKEDFDFNHIYFDNTDQRIIVVGHQWNVPSSWTSDEDYTGVRDNTRAIIGVLDDELGTLRYATIQTDEKAYDAAGKSLGYTDAGDANCVVRANDVPSFISGVAYGWNFYFVATRKGFAVLSAAEGDLFEPALNEDGSNYFIKTPGSAKFVAPTGTSSWYGALYLAEDHSGESESYATKSQARVARFSVNTNASSGFGWIQTWSAPFTRFNPQETDILDFGDQLVLPESISPIDGKNTLCILGSTEYYAALGTGGVYCLNGEGFDGVKKFGNRPVNCVAVDNPVNESGHSNRDAYLYVANGAKLTILNRKTMEEVASWNVPTKDDKGDDIDVAASANYVIVNKAADGVRTVAVAFGQEGLKIFKFNPANL